ncbi:MAG: M6 family metalloprotease domain-containing protein [Gammaproteobacteria bacterium]|nr:M6 family metalloprotease domain-containing protein [Gammaproteobacteria bacterium]
MNTLKKYVFFLFHKIFLTLIFCVFSNTSYGVPAAPGEFTLEQADGSVFQARQWGDEWSHGMETVMGHTIVYEQSSGNWTYAVHDNQGALTPSAAIVGQEVPLEASKNLRFVGSVLEAVKAKRAPSPGSIQKVVPPMGTGRIPVILINFNNTSSTIGTSAFDTLLFGSSGYTMKNYYEEVSYGAFTVAGTVNGWYTANYDHYDYGHNLYGQDAYPGLLVEEAVMAADPSVNFDAYDTDGDCYVDAVAIVHQGMGEEFSGNSTDIWSHRWNLYSASHFGRGSNGIYTTDDNCTSGTGNVKVNDYIIQPETFADTGIMTLGVFAHEYGHVLGLPDLYDIDYDSAGIGNYCLMAGGSWTGISRAGDRPVHVSAWVKKQLGWVTPTAVTSTLTAESILAAANGADVYQFLAGNEYFLVENRYPISGSFDEALPDQGLAIWQIDDTKTNNQQQCYPHESPSCISAHFWVALIQADNQWHLHRGINRGDSADLYVSSSSGISASTAPSSVLYGSAPSNVSVIDISAAGSIMTATLGAGSFTATLATAAVNHTWQAQSLANAYSNPVIIVAPPTRNGFDPGVVRVQSLTGAGFEMRFQEWDYRDGSHVQENIPWLALETGRYTMADGAVWEIGSFNLGGTATWQSVNFTNAFAGTPKLYLTVQSYNGASAVTVRAKSVTTADFQAALYEQESLNDGHAEEVVGYLAIYAPSGSGTVNLAGQDVCYLVQQLTMDSNNPVSGIQIEEEASFDAEIAHITENVDMMLINSESFAQLVSFNGSDPAALRKVGSPNVPVGEKGTLGADHVWQVQNLTGSYQSPVIIAAPPTRNGFDPGVVRVQSLTGTGFEMRFQEWDYRDGSHVQENIPWLALETGRYTMADDAVWEIGSFNLGDTATWQSVSFVTDFVGTPKLYLTVQSYNGTSAVTVRAKAATNTGFQAALYEQESLNDGHAEEVVGYLAIYAPSGNGTVNLAEQDVCYLVQPATVDNATPVLGLVLEEERSADTEVIHLPETVDMLNLDGDTFGQISSFIGADPVALRKTQ